MYSFFYIQLVLLQYNKHVLLSRINLQHDSDGAIQNSVFQYNNWPMKFL
jgi:hypothetical protein